MSRTFWFAAGIASGVYGVFKVKRTIEAFTPDGIGARVAAVRRGARVFAGEVAVAARERETELLAELRASAADDRMLPGAEPVGIAAQAADRSQQSDTPAPGRLTDTTPTQDTTEIRESVTDGNR